MPCILYRAVTELEYTDIVDQGNKFRVTKYSLEAKQFAVSEDCGHYYGREIVMKIDQVDYYLVEVIVDKDKFCLDVMRLDECDAVSIHFELLEEFNTSIISLKTLKVAA